MGPLNSNKGLALAADRTELSLRFGSPDFSSRVWTGRERQPPTHKSSWGEVGGGATLGDQNGLC